MYKVWTNGLFSCMTLALGEAFQYYIFLETDRVVLL